jgi:hypothetical protein
MYPSLIMSSNKIKSLYTSQKKSIATIIRKKKLDTDDVYTFLKLRNDLFSFRGSERPYRVNTGSIAGVLFEWTLQCLLETLIEQEGMEDKLNLLPNYPTSYVKKEHGHSKVNIDLAVTIPTNNENEKSIIYIEAKTNFDDGFDRFYEESTTIRHHRRKNYSGFKYYYIALHGPSVNLKQKYSRQLNNLERRKELILFNWIFKDEETNIEALSKLIKFFRDDIRKLKNL